MKFPTLEGIGEVRGDQTAARTLTLEEMDEQFAKVGNGDEDDEEDGQPRMGKAAQAKNGKGGRRPGGRKTINEY